MWKRLKDILLGATLVAALLPLAALAARTSIDWVNLSGTTYFQPNYPGGLDLLILGSNRYVNFNAVTGSSGYGFRDSAGTLQYKNSGGAWAAFSSGGGGGTGSVGTSSVPTIGGVPYWTTSGATPELLGSTATGTVSGSGGITATAGQSIIGSGLTIGCTAADSSHNGCLQSGDWTTFNNKQTTISSTWPVILTGATLSFGGLGTTTNLTQGQVPYVTGVNTFGQIATGTVTCTGNASCGAGSYVLGNALTINATGSGGGIGDPFTHTSVFGQTTSATSTLLALTGKPYSLVASSTAWIDQLEVGSTTPSNSGGLATSTFYGNVDVKGYIEDDTITNSLVFDGSGGTLGAYAGSSCASHNYAISINGGGTLTCSQISLTADVTGILPIANGGTATSTSGVTNGVEYNDGSKITNSAHFKYQDAVASCEGSTCSRVTLGDPFQIYSSFNGGSSFIISSSSAQDDFIGINAGNLTGGYNGSQSGGFDVGVGRSALHAVSTGYQDVAIGTQALAVLTSGYNDLAVGSLTGNNITIGHDDIFFGNQAGYVRATSTNYAVMVGSLSGTRINDVGTACDGTQGDSWETLVGTYTGQNISTGCSNVFIGGSAGNNDTTGAQNIAIGTWPGQLYGPTTGSNNILIGYNNDLPDDTANNQLDIGNLLYGTSLSSTGSTVATGNLGVATTTPWARLSVDTGGLAAGVPEFDIGSSTRTDFTVTQNGNVGVGSTTPWALLSVAANAWNTYSTPLFSIATSTLPSGNLFSVFGTTTTLGSVSAGADTGVRIGVGANQQDGGGILDQLFVPGRINTDDWVNFECDPGVGIVGVSTANVNNYCPNFSYQTQNSDAINPSVTSGIQFAAICLGTASASCNAGAAAIGGAGLFTSGTQTQFMSATTTPVFDATARIDRVQNATSTHMYLGFTNQAEFTVQNEPTAGCYFVASSTLANWQAECQNASVKTTVDTGVASSTVLSGSGHFFEFRIEMGVSSAVFYLRSNSTPTMTVVANISTNYPSTTGLEATVSVGRLITAGSPSGLDVNRIRVWYRQPALYL